VKKWKKKLEVEGHEYRTDGHYQKDGKEHTIEFLGDDYHGNIAKKNACEKLSENCSFYFRQK